MYVCIYIYICIHIDIDNMHIYHLGVECESLAIDPLLNPNSAQEAYIYVCIYGHIDR